MEVTQHNETKQPRRGLHRKGAQELPVRSCVVCRAQKDPAELVRLSIEEGVLSVGNPFKGRGAWVCVRMACLEALSTSHVSRSFKAATSIEPSFVTELHSLAERRVMEMLGLARRQNGLTLGSDNVLSLGTRDVALAERKGVVVVANDLAERTKVRAGEAAWTFSDLAGLGRACGVGRAGVVFIKPSSIARQAAYWLSVWYESRRLSA